MKKENLPRIEHIEAQVDKLIAQVHNRKVHQGKILAPTIAKYISLYAKIETLLSECYAAFHDEESAPKNAPAKSTIVGEMRLQSSDQSTKRSYWTEYGRTLHSMCYEYALSSDTNDTVYKKSGYECIDMLIRLIQAWYQARLSNPNIPTKYYRFEHINQTIYAFVILFGYYHEMEYVYGIDNALQKFTDEVYDWISELQTSEYLAKNMLYPRCVCECINKPDPKMLTTSALILWELFIREEFSVFCDKYREYSDAPKIDGLEPLYQKLRPDILEMFNANDIESSCELYQIY